MIVLLAYAIMNHALASNAQDSGQLLGWATSGTVLLLDGVASGLIVAGLLPTPTLICLVMGGGRVALIFFGARSVVVSYRGSLLFMCNDEPMRLPHRSTLQVLAHRHVHGVPPLRRRACALGSQALDSTASSQAYAVPEAACSQEATGGCQWRAG